MKKLFVVLSIFLFVSSIFAQALNLESFRHQATYIIRDDLDNAIDGTDLLGVDGGRLFTNLSNLSSGTEELMGYDSDNTFVIGCITPELFGYRTAFLWGTYRDVDPDWLGLDLDGNGVDDFWGNGFLTGEWTRRWDANNDGSLDFEDYRFLQEAGEEGELESDILLNIAKDMGDNGFAFTYQRTAYEGTYDWSDTTYEQSRDLSTQDLEYYWREADHENGVYTMPSNNFNVAYTTPFMDWRLRGDVYFNMANVEDSWTETGHYFENNAPASTVITDTYLGNNSEEWTDKYSVNEMGVGVRLENEDSELLWKVGGHFGMAFGSGDYIGNEKYLHDWRYMNAGNVAIYTEEFNGQVAGPASVSGMDMGVSGRMKWQLADNVCFGLGGVFNSYRFTREYDLDSSYVYREVYDDGDADPNDPDDYVYTENGGISAIRTNELVVNSFEVPAGIEVNIGKNKDWFIRFGALAVKEIVNGKEIFEVGEVERLIATEITGAGDTTITYSDVEYQSTKENDYVENSSASFAYGLGWKPAENLSIDLIGMFDASGTELLSTDWFQSLKLSATVFFK
ncbi:hypothetical protein KAW18_04955 [candidate division WOR-3 bacterium]|nr:hypothetical protein [candidate division WOR-3 bacterium]